MATLQLRCNEAVIQNSRALKVAWQHARARRVSRPPPFSWNAWTRLKARWTATSGSAKQSRLCVHAVTGVPDVDSDECVDDSEEPKYRRLRKRWMRRMCCAAFLGAHNDGEDGLEIAAAAEKAIIRLKKTRQTSIIDFFAAK
uniref:Putative tick transposon n=1 Tax=Ixodes ricinus TaxID=34613 RepID=A0A6B0UTC1_IXORI